jgi:hypothetical protein
MQFEITNLRSWFIYCRDLAWRTVDAAKVHAPLRPRLRSAYVEGVKYHLSAIEESERPVAALVGSYGYGCESPYGNYWLDIIWDYKLYCCDYCSTGNWLCIGRCMGYWQCTEDCIARKWCIPSKDTPFDVFVREQLLERNLDASWV